MMYVDYAVLKVLLILQNFTWYKIVHVFNLAIMRLLTKIAKIIIWCFVQSFLLRHTPSPHLVPATTGNYQKNSATYRLAGYPPCTSSPACPVWRSLSWQIPASGTWMLWGLWSAVTNSGQPRPLWESLAEREEWGKVNSQIWLHVVYWCVHCFAHRIGPEPQTTGCPE